VKDGKMHQTTVRFSPDLWEAMEQECARLGVSAAQYLREAALARLSYTGGRRGNPEYEVALAYAGAVSRAARAEPQSAGSPSPLPVEEAAAERLEDSRAVSAQSEMARLHARQIRDESQRLRRLRRQGA
jgi:hypothetical protein